MPRQQIPPSYRFVHLRRTTDGQPNSPIQSRSGATLAYVKDTDPDGNPIVLMAAAFCHPNDNYSKRLGRAKAAGRLTQLGLNRNLVDDDTYWIVRGDDARAEAYNVADKLAFFHDYAPQSR